MQEWSHLCDAVTNYAPHYSIWLHHALMIVCEWLNGSYLCSTFHPNLVCQLYGYHVLNVAKAMSHYGVANNCCTVWSLYTTCQLVKLFLVKRHDA